MSASAMIDLIYQHGSVRSYKPDPVPDELIRSIVEAGQRSSTSSNLQMYSVVVVKGQARREELSVLCGQQAFIAQAPVFLAWCADLSRLDRVCQAIGYSHVSGYMENLLLSLVDVSLAAQNATLAAEAHSLGICYIGGIRNNLRQVVEMLQLPRLVFPLFGMTLGYPEREPRTRPRLPLEAILHWEQYDSSTEHVLLEKYDLDMVATGIYRGRQVVTPGTPGAGQTSIKEEVYGWTEHSARRASQVHRAELRQVLIDQGFEMK